MNVQKGNKSKIPAAEGETCREIGTNLRSARRLQNITQKELSLRTGIIQANISRIENGRGNPSLRTILRLAEALNLRTRIIFTPAR
jgi:transcriptional regulator with XRE-family HTH domain